jgi:3-keto-5-aminohexanoate cleavage enzyme
MKSSTSSIPQFDQYWIKPMTAPTIIMIAPNGARKTRLDHPALPVSIKQTVDEAVQCHAEGATILHAHVRGKQDEHLLDAGLYRELIAEMKHRAPDMLVQITTETVGVYTPVQQVDCVQAVVPEMASVALKEMTSNFTDLAFAKRFYAWTIEAGVHIQHILFSDEELIQFLKLKQNGVIPASHRCVLFVLGRYAANFQSYPTDLDPFLVCDLAGLDWFVCAFGAREQACIRAAIDNGGHARIGFENNLYLPDGDVAANTAELVSELAKSIAASDRSIASNEQTRQLLGLRSA